MSAFRNRGEGHVSRLESFSDAVFGFSVTLLVVSLQVPKSFDDLMRALSGFPAFALTFALLALIWFLQYRFFRRYALQDGTTIALNLALLFVIVFFTYPLKFLANIALPVGSVTPTAGLRVDQIVPLYLTYGLGYAAVFAILGLLCVHALRKRDELELTPAEVFLTERSALLAATQIGVAALSVGVAGLLTAVHAYAAAARAGGIVYALIPALVAIVGRVHRRRDPTHSKSAEPAGEELVAAATAPGDSRPEPAAEP